MREPSLIAACTTGLANRLLMLAGAQRLARLTDRKLALYWPENDQLDCPFDALFKNPPDMFRERDMHQLLRSDRTMKVYNTWQCPPLYDEVSRDGDTAEMVLLKGWTAPKFADEKLADIRDELCEELRRLTPVDEVRAAVAAIGLPERCLGVHVRHEELCEGENCFPESKPEYFEAILRKLAEVCGESTFLLATLRPEVERRFREVFGERVIAMPKSGRGRERRAIREALIDLLLLSRTHGVIGHHGSTFSQVAAMLGPRVLVMATQTTATTGLETTARRFVQTLNGGTEHHLEL